MKTTNSAAWAHWNGVLQEPKAYADTVTYELAADWVKDCHRVEDWGCGGGWMRQFISEHAYIGVDGSGSPYADVIADLAEYRSDTEGLVMRHVLEHNYQWEIVLQNALDSFTKRMALVLFVPLGNKLEELEWEEDPGVPTLKLPRLRLLNIIKQGGATVVSNEKIKTDAKYDHETVILMEKQ